MKNLTSFSVFLFSLFLLCGLLATRPASAQLESSAKYWVLLKDKKGVSFDPFSYFDQKAIDRRINQNLPLFDESDKPLNATYLAKVSETVTLVTGQSRWLNAVACLASPTQIMALQQLPFVNEVIPMEPAPAILAQAPTDQIPDLKAEDLEILVNQTASLGAHAFKAKNLDGTGVRIAVLDAGFEAVDKSPAFDHLRSNKRILKTWDFVKGKEFVYGFATHGTMVLSCIAGRVNNQDLGMATGAEFLLARTERMHTEKMSEEENWLAAMEWADKNGADIINSSLGYTYHRYFREQMDGKTSLVTRAANMAADKGILVVNAAGNDGSGNWKNLGAPADGEKVLTVGGIDPDNRYHVNFSSFGPTAVKRMKPNVTAFGVVIAAGPKGLTRTQGTSFASPLVAGFAACSWQHNRKLTNMELFREIEKAGHLYPYFDYAHGFGLPQASAFLNETGNVPEPTVQFETRGDQLHILIKPEFLPRKEGPFSADSTGFSETGRFQIQVKKQQPDYLYYHIVNPKGFLDKYFVVDVTEGADMAQIDLNSLKPGFTIRAFYKGYTGTYSR